MAEFSQQQTPGGGVKPRQIAPSVIEPESEEDERWLNQHKGEVVSGAVLPSKREIPMGYGGNEYISMEGLAALHAPEFICQTEKAFRYEEKAARRKEALKFRMQVRDEMVDSLKISGTCTFFTAVSAAAGFLFVPEHAAGTFAGSCVNGFRWFGAGLSGVAGICFGVVTLMMLCRSMTSMYFYLRAKPMKDASPKRMRL